MTLEPSDLVALVLLATASLACGALVRARQWRAALAVWIAAIVGVTLPVMDLHAHAHWQSVAWIPFRSAPIKLSDVLVNLALYLPLGYLFRQNRLGLGGAIALAAALSVSLELSQVFSHTRIASGTDVACNSIGAILGFEGGIWVLSRIIKV